jgi:hypothetical protein
LIYPAYKFAFGFAYANYCSAIFEADPGVNRKKPTPRLGGFDMTIKNRSFKRKTSDAAEAVRREAINK